MAAVTPPFRVVPVKVDGRTRHAVADGEGRVVSASYDHAAHAAQLLRGFERRARQARRACLCCGEGFKSEGAHHRLCDACRRRGAALHGVAAQAVSVGRAVPPRRAPT